MNNKPKPIVFEPAHVAEIANAFNKIPRIKFNREQEELFINDIPPRIDNMIRKEAMPKNNRLDEKQVEKILNTLNSGGSILDTIGIEVESCGLTQDQVISLFRKLEDPLSELLKMDRDGSVEMSCQYADIGGKTICLNASVPHKNAILNNIVKSTTFGYEIVSRPAPYEVVTPIINMLLPLLDTRGDFVSDRCSIHVHIGFPKKLSYLKRALVVGLWADDLLFSIAGAGGTFRGNYNNAIYARPLIAGPIVRMDGNLFRVLNWTAALEAETISEFFLCYGYNINNAIKYHPARYFAWNIVSVILKGTLEFRYLNQTFNPALVNSFINLVQCLTELILSNITLDSTLFPISSIFIQRDVEYFIDKLNLIKRISKTNNFTYPLLQSSFDILTNIIAVNEPVQIEKNVYTHLKDPKLAPKSLPILIIKEKPRLIAKDNHIDIHNLNVWSILD